MGQAKDELPNPPTNQERVVEQIAQSLKAIDNDPCRGIQPGDCPDGEDSKGFLSNELGC